MTSAKHAYAWNEYDPQVNTVAGCPLEIRSDRDTRSMTTNAHLSRLIVCGTRGGNKWISHARPLVGPLAVILMCVCFDLWVLAFATDLTVRG